MKYFTKEEFETIKSVDVIDRLIEKSGQKAFEQITEESISFIFSKLRGLYNVDLYLKDDLSNTSIDLNKMVKDLVVYNAYKAIYDKLPSDIQDMYDKLLKRLENIQKGIDIIDMDRYFAAEQQRDIFFASYRMQTSSINYNNLI